MQWTWGATAPENRLIRFVAKKSEPIDVVIYNLRGIEVVRLHDDAGVIEWDGLGGELGSGVFFAKISGAFDGVFKFVSTK